MKRLQVHFDKEKFVDSENPTMKNTELHKVLGVPAELMSNLEEKMNQMLWAEIRSPRESTTVADLMEMLLIKFSQEEILALLSFQMMGLIAEKLGKPQKAEKASKDTDISALFFKQVPEALKFLMGSTVDDMVKEAAIRDEDLREMMSDPRGEELLRMMFYARIEWDFIKTHNKFRDFLDKQ